MKNSSILGIATGFAVTVKKEYGEVQSGEKVDVLSTQAIKAFHTPPYYMTIGKEDKNGD